MSHLRASFILQGGSAAPLRVRFQFLECPEEFLRGLRVLQPQTRIIPPNQTRDPAQRLDVRTRGGFRTGQPNQKSRTLREHVGSLKFQLDLAIRTVIREDAELQAKAKAAANKAEG